MHQGINLGFHFLCLPHVPITRHKTLITVLCEVGLLAKKPQGSDANVRLGKFPNGVIVKEEAVGGESEKLDF